MPEQPGLTVAGQRSMATFLAALILWVGKPVPIHLTSLVVILLLPLIGAVENQKVAFGTLGFEVIWLMVAAFVLTSAMSKTNLGSRISLQLLTRFGTTPTRTLAVLVAVNFILAFFVPSTTARASLLVPIVIIILEIYKAKPGESNLGKLMTLQGVQNTGIATTMIMTATSGQVIALGFINEQAGGNLGYMDWLIGSLPQAILTAIIAFVVGLKLFNFKDEIPNGSESKKIKQRLQSELDSLGSISSAEKKAAFIFGFTLLSWATGDYQEQLLGFSLSTEQTALLAMILCFLPGIGVLQWKDADIKWDLMLFSAGAYAAGNALNDSGGAGWLIGGLVDLLNLEALSHPLVAVILIFVTVFSHFIFTSKTVRTTILIPAIIGIAQSLGMDPVPLALACSFGISYTITLPPHSKVNTLYFGTGYFTVADQLKYGIITCFIGSVMISLTYFFWLGIIL